MKFNPTLLELQPQPLLLNHKNTKAAPQAYISHSIMGDFSYLEYALCQTNNSVNINVADAPGFYFLYCWAGELKFRLQNGHGHNLLPHQSALLNDRFGKGIAVEVMGQGESKFCVIGFTEKRHPYYAQLRSQFYANLTQGGCVFVGRPYLKLLDKVEALSHLSKEDVSSELIMEGLVFQILGLKMKHLLESQKEGREDVGSLTSREMEQVKRMVEIINAKPAANYTVKWLCRETGLSPAKLQEGFKVAYGRTVIDYIRDVRLEKARELIRTSDLNISEVVYSIGLTSRSYFSKIFKQKFKCSPKIFQEQVRGGW